MLPRRTRHYNEFFLAKEAPSNPVEGCFLINSVVHYYIFFVVIYCLLYWGVLVMRIKSAIVSYKLVLCMVDKLLRTSLFILESIATQCSFSAVAWLGFVVSPSLLVVDGVGCVGLLASSVDPSSWLPFGREANVGKF